MQQQRPNLHSAHAQQFRRSRRRCIFLSRMLHAFNSSGVISYSRSSRTPFQRKQLCPTNFFPKTSIEFALYTSSCSLCVTYPPSTQPKTLIPLTKRHKPVERIFHPTISICQQVLTLAVNSLVLSRGRPDFFVAFLQPLLAAGCFPLLPPRPHFPLHF